MLFLVIVLCDYYTDQSSLRQAAFQAVPIVFIVRVVGPYAPECKRYRLSSIAVGEVFWHTMRNHCVRGIIMPRQLKVYALLTFLLVMLFYLFFQVSKHNLALSQVNAFAEDPYDAVGSFGVLLVLFTALLSVVRAFRPYQSHKVLDDQKALLARGEALTCLAVGVTLVADVVAMIRYPSVWIGFPAGYVLAALIAGMALLTGLVGWLVARSIRRSIVLFVQGRWIRAVGVSLVGMLVLVLYPENWRQSIPGALFTVLVGMLCLFVPVWAWGMAVSPSIGTQHEDFIDDLASVYGWIKAHTGRLVVFWSRFERVRDWPLVRPMLDWLNPRKHSWNLCVLCGVFVGGALALGEVLGEGISYQMGRLAIVVAIFMGFGCLGVLLGYLLLAKLLGLFRHVSA
jgi:hypothetical protein